MKPATEPLWLTPEIRVLTREYVAVLRRLERPVPVPESAEARHEVARRLQGDRVEAERLARKLRTLVDRAGGWEAALAWLEQAEDAASLPPLERLPVRPLSRWQGTWLEVLIGVFLFGGLAALFTYAFLVVE